MGAVGPRFAPQHAPLHGRACSYRTIGGMGLREIRE
jgi:hypothetical protein